MKTANIKNGSALIMTIVLTALLAVVGIVFVMMARMEKTATSARSESEELKLAADTIVGQIEQKLASDVPQPPNAGYPDYYDYPGRWMWNSGTSTTSPDFTNANDSWLANLEPYDNGPAGSPDYRWRHISDIYNQFAANGYDVQAGIVADYPTPISTAMGNSANLADADGDGVSDARWVEVPNLTTSKGKPVYAAVRIVDNGGMLNVNTAYLFDPTNPGTNGVNIDGSSQMQINLFELANRDSDVAHTTPVKRARLFYERFDTTGIVPLPGATVEPGQPIYDNYTNNVVWPIQPTGTYTPFDISDELNLRNRYFLGSDNFYTRIEELWNNAYDDFGLTTPRTDPVQFAANSTYWFDKVNDNSANPLQYDYRHISTIYNTDRVIMGTAGTTGNLAGTKMWCINDALDAVRYPNGVQDFYDKVLVPYVRNNTTLTATDKDKYLAEFAQLAANIKDYSDPDSIVATVIGKDNLGNPTTTYYGFERPIIYISELAFDGSGNGTNIELYTLFTSDTFTTPGEWQLEVVGQPAIDIFSTDFVGQFCVKPINFVANDTIQLKRRLSGGSYVVVDAVTVPTPAGSLSYERDLSANRLILRLWGLTASSSLGALNAYTGVGGFQMWHPNGSFKNVGDIGYMLRKPVYYPDGTLPSTDVIGYPVGANITTDTEAKVRIDLADPIVQGLFQYLAVFDPGAHTGNAATETRVKGRININTAPWFVIAQLPWLSHRNDGTYTPNPNYALAKAIVAYRDKKPVDGYATIDYTDRGGDAITGTGTGLKKFLGANYANNPLSEIPGFASIGELTTVINNATLTNAAGATTDHDYSMWYYAIGNNNGKTGDQIGYPDLTTTATLNPDAVANDFEKRNLIFARISDLVTVRSDVFTAYILIRLGENGPQRRVMATLDRSGYPSEPVRVIALHSVPDAR